MDMNLGKRWQIVRGRDAQHTPVYWIKESDTTGRSNNNGDADIENRLRDKMGRVGRRGWDEWRE